VYARAQWQHAHRQSHHETPRKSVAKSWVLVPKKNPKQNQNYILHRQSRCETPRKSAVMSWTLSPKKIKIKIALHIFSRVGQKSKNAFHIDSRAAKRREE